MKPDNAHPDPTPAPRYWAQLGTHDFAHLDAACSVALLPVGATEQHGPHLPLGVDTLLADAFVAAALAHLPASASVLVLPTQAIGKSNEHAGFAGTLSLSASTLIALWTDIGECVARSGIKKLLIFNAHGGQAGLMDVVARDLRARCNLLVVCANWYDLPLPEAVQGLFSAHEQRFGNHAGDVETSLMLALQPAQVRMAQAQNFHSTSQDRAAKYPILGNGKSAKFAWQMQDLNPQGATGNAALATAEKGQALLAAAGPLLAALLLEIADLPLATLVPPPAA